MMLGLQDPNSYSMEFLTDFHDYSVFLMLGVVSCISYMLLYLFIGGLTNRFFLDSSFLEVIWTVLPMVFLFFMAIPSLMLLYLLEDYEHPLLTVKVIGHQWYWSYEYSDYQDVYFDSYLLNNSLFRLYEVDNRVVFPWQGTVRLLVSSSDVIHSWSIPSFGVKMDSVPGRVNQVLIKLIRPGVYYGQCSEICGMNHSFMPVVAEVCDFKGFINWLCSFLFI